MSEAKGDESSAKVKVFDPVTTTGAEGMPASFINNNQHFNLIGKTIIIQSEPFQKTEPKDHSVFAAVSFDLALDWLVLTYLILTVCREISYI